MMQTFLPYPDFRRSAQCLDMQRLGKQRVECLQLLNAAAGFSKGWRHHPARLMWEGYEGALLHYAKTVCVVWRERGYNDTVLDHLAFFNTIYADPKPPPWLGHAPFHEAHQSNLIRKDPEFYRQYDWAVPDDLPYLWPINVRGSFIT